MKNRQFTGLVSHQNKTLMNQKINVNKFRHILFLFSIVSTDLENDKIRVTCDDDLKFFMEESACHKIIFDFNPATELELSRRKRSWSQMNENFNECSKKIRKQLQEIDLSSDSSSMSISDDDNPYISPGASTSFDSSKNSSLSNVSQKSQNDLPSTSAAALNHSQKVNIISVDIIKMLDEQVPIGAPDNENDVQCNEPLPFDTVDGNGNETPKEAIEIPDDNGNDVQIVDDEETRKQAVAQETSQIEETAQGSSQKDSTNKKSDKKRIVISDSSDDESHDTTNNNRRFFDGPRSGTYSSSYSFNTDRNFESRASYGSCPRNRFRRSNSDRSYYERPFEFQNHMRAFHENARFARDQAERTVRASTESVRIAREQAARAVQVSTAAIPEMVSNFRAHFVHPLFRVADINQHVFSTFNRRH